jgi:hypothetical protein
MTGDSTRPQQSEDVRKVEQYALLGATVTTAAVTAGIGSQVIETQTSEFDKSMWNPALFERDVAINKMPILLAHNSGSEGGSGTMFFNQNQTMTPYDLLNKTPVHGFEFQVEDYNGTLITNHGAALTEYMIDPTVSNPETLQSQLDSVKEWLSQPGNSDQVVFIQIQNNTSLNLDSYLSDTFGSEVAYGVAYPNSTINELAAAGKHVVILPNSMNDIFRTGGGYSFSDYWEDRTLLGNLGNEVTASMPLDQQFVGSLNTDDVDKLIEKGGVIKLDDIAPNDPRLLASEYRDHLSFDPDVYLFDGLIQVNRGLLSALTFTGGVLSAIGAATFSIANSIYQTYKSYHYIQNAQQHFQDAMKKTELSHLLAYKKKNSDTANITAEDIDNYAKAQCLSYMRVNTIKNGAVGTTSLAISLFTIGLLFPVAFPVMSILTIVTLGLGLVTTGLATYLNVRTLANKFIHNTTVSIKISTEQAEKLNHALLKTENIKYKLMLEQDENDNRIANIGHGLLATTLIFRTTSLAKNVIAVIGLVGAAALSIAAFAKSALDAILNYQNRQKHLANIPKMIIQASLPGIDDRKYQLFGETALEKFINKNKNYLISKYKLPQDLQKLSSRQFIQTLANKDNTSYNNILLGIRKLCIADILQNDFEKLCAEKPGTSTNEQLKNFFFESISNYIGKDVRSSGRENIVKLVFATIASGSFIAPPLAGVFLGIGLGMLIVGELVTRVVAYIEIAKFKKAAGTVIETALSENANEEQTNETKETLSLIKLVKPSVAGTSANLSKRLKELVQTKTQSSIDNVPLTTTPVDRDAGTLNNSNRFLRLFDETDAKQSQTTHNLQLPLLRPTH